MSPALLRVCTAILDTFNCRNCRPTIKRGLDFDDDEVLVMLDSAINKVDFCNPCGQVQVYAGVCFCT